MDDNLDLEYERLLGEGSYGKVFLVKQQDGQKFAVKEIDLSKCDETGRAQALREATILARLKHSNILKYIESVINDDCLYIVTEYCGGGDLEDYLQMLVTCRQYIPESLVTEWVLELGEALKYLHDMKILHRDMKTKNIFLTEDLSVKLGDLGIAKVLDLNQSKADTFIGTPSYMSPELFTGKSYNHKTDIWGLGCCVYEMMTLKRAFQGKALWTLIREIKNGKVLELPDRYSLELRALVQEMMSQDPADRPSAKDIVQNDYLTYHRGRAQDIVNQLPKPNQQVEKKTSSKSSSGSSGSFGRMLKQKGRSEDDRFRQSINSVCEKLNTLNMRQGQLGDDCNEDDEDMSTFVYKGVDGDELEAEGTVLNSELLQQYTEQLDTFVFKGFDETETEGTIKATNADVSDSPSKAEEKDDADASLLRQYSSTLEDIDTDNDEEEENVEDDPDTEDEFIETIKPELTSKYQYKGLKDTFQLKPNRKWRDVRNVDFVASSASPDRQEISDMGRSSANEMASKTKKHPFEGKSLSSSLSSTSSMSHSSNKTTDPRLMRTASLDGGNKAKMTKVKTCDRIMQTAKQKLEIDQLVQTKEAFVNEVPVQDLTSSLNAQDVMSNLRKNLTPIARVPSTGGVSEAQDSANSTDLQESPGKGKKKKKGFLKKEAQKKQSDKQHEEVQSPGSAEQKVTLFTRGQTAAFSKDDDEEDADSSGLDFAEVNGNHGDQQLAEIESMLHDKKSEEVINEHIFYIQSELASAVGVDNLRQLLGIMSMVKDDKEIQLHASNILGPKTYQQYSQHFHILTILERQVQGSSF